MSGTSARAGYSLIEMVVVIAIIGLLGAMLLPIVLNQAEKSRESRGIADVRNLAKSIARMRTDTGNSSSGCLTLVGNLAFSLPLAQTVCGPALTQCQSTTPNETCWGGPYMIQEMAPGYLDPWGNYYTATEDPATSTVTVLCNGPDGTTPSSDDITFTQ